MSTITVIKKDGTRQLFDPSKLEESLRRSGAKEEMVKKITSYISEKIVDGDTTDKIYREAYEMLADEKDQGSARYRYSLRRAVSELGPTGFAFEKFVGQVYARRGYTTSIGIKIPGKCITHEVDVVAENEDDLITAELKFHNKLNIKTDLKVALYVNSRFIDIKDTGYYGEKNALPYLITNTKFTSNVINYTECEKTLNLLGWDYPRNSDNLHDVIQLSKVHPVTALTSFSKHEHGILLDAGIVTCQDVKKNGGEDVYKLGLIKRSSVKEAFEEIDTICLK